MLSVLYLIVMLNVAIVSFMLSVVFLFLCSVLVALVVSCAEGRYAECRYAKCRYAECRGASYNCFPKTL